MDGLVVGSTALIAGAVEERALLLGLSMVALQFGIGATNDVIDAPRDAGLKPAKPIPAGLVSPGEGRILAIAAFAAGLGLAAVAGTIVFGLAVIVVAIGLAYDLRLKGTPWSWLPFAIGIPVLPVYGWAGAVGSLPGLFALVMPVAVAAGAALAIANSLVDVERDRAVGVGSIAVSLGPRRAWAVNAALVAGIVATATASASGVGDLRSAAPVMTASLVPIVGAAIGYDAGVERRERAWQVQAVGFAILAIAWLAVVLR